MLQGQVASKARKDAVAAAYHGKQRVKRIAANYLVSTQTVRNWSAEAGHPPRNDGRLGVLADIKRANRIQAEENRKRSLDRAFLNHATGYFSDMLAVFHSYLPGGKREKQRRRRGKYS